MSIGDWWGRFSYPQHKHPIKTHDGFASNDDDEGLVIDRRRAEAVTDKLQLWLHKSSACYFTNF
jgi:hypothetical protein